MPSLINHYFENAAAELVFQDERASQEAFDSLQTLWWFVWGGYYVLVAVVGVVLGVALLRQDGGLECQPRGLRAAFDAALDRLGLQAGAAAAAAC